MRAEVISIGDELTSGRSLDTNAQWLSRELQSLGVRVLYHTTVGDELQPIVDVFRAAIARADVVLVTGGLGPTDDDLTRQALAETLGRPLVSDPAALDHIRRLFARRGRDMPPKNAVQASLPEGAHIVPNPHGTAPGIAAEAVGEQGRRAHVFCLPGVPAEMREMWAQTVEGELRGLGAGRRVIRTRLVRCFGAGESAIEAMLPGLIRRDHYPRVGITASEATITLSVTAEGATDEECEAAMGPTLSTIRECLGDLIYGYDHETLETAVIGLLLRLDRTLAIVECATGGQLIERLWPSAVTGVSPRTRGGLVARGETLTTVLGIRPETAAALAGGPALVETVAEAVRHAFDADYGLAVGPFSSAAGGFPPTAATPDAPPPVAFALATPDGVRTKTFVGGVHPALETVFLAKTALNFLRLELLKAM